MFCLRKHEKWRLFPGRRQRLFLCPECRGWEFFAGVKGRPLIGSRAEALPSELSLRQFVLGITCRKRKVMQLRCGCRRVQKRRKNE